MGRNLKYNDKQIEGSTAPTTAAPTTAAPTTAVPALTIGRINDRVDIEQLSDNQWKVSKSSNNGKTNIFFNKECDYYTIKIVKAKNFNSFGWSINDASLWETWTSDMGFKKHTIGSFSGGTQRYIFNSLSGTLVYKQVDRKNIAGDTIKLS